MAPTFRIAEIAKAVKTKNIFSIESHPWNFHIPETATKLLIGTFTTNKRNRKHDFFYCSATNRFWEVMSGIVGESLKANVESIAIEERKNVLNALKLGVTDMGSIVTGKRVALVIIACFLLSL